MKAKSKPVPARPEITVEQRVQFLADIEQHILRDLVLMVNERDREVAKVVKAIEESPGEFARAASWGKGVEEDVQASYAAEALAHIKNGRPIPEVLEYQAEAIRRMQLNNYFVSNSTNPFHNAVEMARGNAARMYRERAESWMYSWTVTRAQAEVL